MEELSLHILDIMANSLRAAAKNIKLEIISDNARDMLGICVCDDGKGMTPGQLERAGNPFFTTKPRKKVGLGLALMKQTCEQSEGEFSISSHLGEGTDIKASMKLSHPDRPVMGDLPSTLITVISGLEEATRLYFRMKDDQWEYDFDTAEIAEYISPMQLTDPAVLQMLHKEFNKNIDRRIQ